MPRYFFHTADGGRCRDRSGTPLPDDAAARAAAIRFAGDVLSDEPDLLRDGKDFRVEVTDEQGVLLFTIVTQTVDAPRLARTGTVES